MRILQIAPPWFPVPPPGYGGTELVVSALTDGLVAMGHDVTLVASGGSRTSAHLCTVYDRAPSRQLGDSVTELPHVLAGHRRRADFDLVHDHTPLGASLASLAPGPPVVHTVHGPWEEPLVRLYRTICRQVHLVAISHDHAGRAPVDIVLAGIVHNGIDVDRYPFNGDPSRHLAWLGRAGPDKGADLAVEVARRTGRPLRIGMKVNEPAEERWWHEVLEPRIVGQPVEVTFNATHRQKVELLRDALALLAPLRWDEPFGLVLVEAQACGTPVIAFARGAAPELVADGTTGVVVAPDDLDAMVDAVDRVGALERRDCRARVVERFSAARMVDGYATVYDRVLDR